MKEHHQNKRSALEKCFLPPIPLLHPVFLQFRFVFNISILSCSSFSVRIRKNKMYNTKNDYYSKLGVSRQASPSIIKKSFHALALRLHPDKNADKDVEVRVKNEEWFKEVSQAYQTLSCKSKKEAYDLVLAEEDREARRRRVVKTRITKERSRPGNDSDSEDDFYEIYCSSPKRRRSPRRNSTPHPPPADRSKSYYATQKSEDPFMDSFLHSMQEEEKSNGKSSFR